MFNKDGATLASQVAEQKTVLSKEAEADALDKAGNTLESVGRLFQGEDVALTPEAQEHLISALRVASANSDVLSEEGSEAPQVAAHKPVLSKEAEADALDKAGKTLETVGRLLQGEDVALTPEAQEHLISALRVATANGEVLSEEGSEHIWPIIIRGVVQGAIAHVVHKKLNKG
ncbi:hypothetical protein MTO96_030277 [Rhipicephalus appendiculatus]